MSSTYHEEVHILVRVIRRGRGRHGRRAVERVAFPQQQQQFCLLGQLRVLLHRLHQLQLRL
eukprot:659231-Pyramimonas_sp.AAC.1